MPFTSAHGGADEMQPSVAEWETKGIAEWFDHHLALQMPEERVEDEEKIVHTRYQSSGRSVHGISR